MQSFAANWLFTVAFPVFKPNLIVGDAVPCGEQGFMLLHIRFLKHIKRLGWSALALANWLCTVALPLLKQSSIVEDTVSCGDQTLYCCISNA